MQNKTEHLRGGGQSLFDIKMLGDDIEDIIICCEEKHGSDIGNNSYSELLK